MCSSVHAHPRACSSSAHLPATGAGGAIGELHVSGRSRAAECQHLQTDPLDALALPPIDRLGTPGVESPSFVDHTASSN